MPKLTQTFANKTPFKPSGSVKHWDTEVKGLGLFVGKQSKTWYFQKDVGGVTKRVLIGRFPIISANAARSTAQELLLEMSRGLGKSVQLDAPTLETAMEAYLSRAKLRSENYKYQIRMQFKKHLRDWLKLPLTEISKAMVAERHRSLRAVPSAANHALRQFRSVWNHARRIHDLPESPTIAIEWYAEETNGDIIDDLRTWEAAVCELQNPIHKAFYQLLLFTGFRKAEAFTLQWKNVHEDRIHLPITKNGRSFDLPILDIHHEILAPVKGLSRKWVFPSPQSHQGHITNPERLTWSPHAHRRTFATVAVEEGLLEETVGRLLNHTPLSITGRRYAKPSLDALRPAMQTACDALEERSGLLLCERVGG
ncbi:MAG: integrase family protein [Pseudomonadota bacterium]